MPKVGWFGQRKGGACCYKCKQPEPPGGLPCEACENNITPAQFQLVVTGVVPADPVNCQDCVDLNGTWILDQLDTNSCTFIQSQTPDLGDCHGIWNLTLQGKNDGSTPLQPYLSWFTGDGSGGTSWEVRTTRGDYDCTGLSNVLLDEEIKANNFVCNFENAEARITAL